MIHLSQFNLKVIYRKGGDNIEADALSSNPVLKVLKNEEDYLKIVKTNKLEDIITDWNTITEETGNSKNIKRDSDINFKMLKKENEFTYKKNLVRILST